MRLDSSHMQKHVLLYFPNCWQLQWPNKWGKNQTAKWKSTRCHAVNFVLKPPHREKFGSCVGCREGKGEGGGLQITAPHFAELNNPQSWPSFWWLLLLLFEFCSSVGFLFTFAARVPNLRFFFPSAYMLEFCFNNFIQIEFRRQPGHNSKPSFSASEINISHFGPFTLALANELPPTFLPLSRCWWLHFDGAAAPKRKPQKCVSHKNKF